METFVLVMLGIVISVVCAAWCASHAMDKGHSPGLWGVLGFLFPLIAVIVIALIPPSENAR